MFFAGGKGKGGQEGTQAVSGRDLTPEARVKQVQEHMEQYVDLVRQKAPAEKIKKAEETLSKEIGRDSFQRFKQQLPRQLRVRRALDAQRTYDHFRLPGRRRIVHDRRGLHGRRARMARARAQRAAGRRGPSTRATERAADHARVRDGKLVKEHVRTYVNYLGERMTPQAQAQKSAVRAQIDELLSKFEKLIIKRFEGDQQVARQLKDGKPTFLKKTEAQWKQFFARFASRILKKRVPTKNIQQFMFRGMVPKGAKGVVISDMTLASGRVERFVRFSILADAMAKLQKMLPGQKFGKEMLTGEELYYLALAVARGREYKGTPKAAEGLFMSGAAEEKAAQELGLRIAPHLQQKPKEQQRKGGRGAFAWREGKERVFDETPYQFIPWWHWGNLKPGGPHRSTTVAFYLGLGVIAVLGILAMTAYLLK